MCSSAAGFLHVPPWKGLSWWYVREGKSKRGQFPCPALQPALVAGNIPPSTRLLVEAQSHLSSNKQKSKVLWCASDLLAVNLFSEGSGKGFTSMFSHTKVNGL